MSDEKVRELLRNTVRESSPLGPDVAFGDDTLILGEGIIDSLGIFGVMTEIETQLGFSFPPDELTEANFESIDSMAALVGRLMEAGTISKEAVG